MLLGVFAPPPPWTNQDLVLYHGTIDTHAASLVAGVSLAHCTARTDFGKGFYTTTLLRQAQSWAWLLAQRRPGAKPVVIKFTLSRNALSGLQAVWFVRGDFNATDFWSLVCYCHTGSPPHARTSPMPAEYDLVVGPVSASWRQRLALSGVDQISFHTSGAVSVLNKGLKQVVR